jgi:hypothetical protein
VGSRRDCTWILGLSGFRVVTADSEGETAESRLTIRIADGVQVVAAPEPRGWLA